MIGRTIGRYRILEKLGEGGMGSVWKAEDPVLRRTVAIKVLAAGLWDSAEARERFLREARAVSRLEHSGIAAVHDFGEVDGSPFIAFQFVAGRTFHQLLVNGPLPAVRALELTAAAADALAHAHARGVLHRDVTANNLMLADDGRVVVVDFGLALPSGGTRVTRSAMSMGTVGYMAPEMFRGELASERTDVYGLGAVLYRLLTGRLPFEASTVEAMMYRMMNDPLAPPSQMGRAVPPACDGPVARALARDPADRWASAAELAAALRAARTAVGAGAAAPGALSGAVTVARRVGGTLSRAADRARRSKLVAGVVAGLALALVVALSWAWREGLLSFAGEQVVAVLPVRVEGEGAEEYEHIPGALGEELVIRLDDIAGLRALPWATTARYPSGSRQLKELARELRARYVVEGSLRLEGDRARLTLNVLDASHDRQLRSVQFDESPDSLFALEHHAAIGIAEHLKGILSTRDRRALATAPAVSAEAYDYLVKGSYFLSSSDPNTRAQAELFYRKALDLDPNYADAWVGMGAIVSDRFFRGERGGVANLEIAERNYRRALELDPRNTKSLQGLVLVNWELGRSEEVLKLAARAGPRSSNQFEVQLIHGIANLLTGAPDRAVLHLQRALALDPGNVAATWYHVIARNWMGDYDGCIQAGRDFTKRFGEDSEVLTWMGASYAGKRMYPEARLCFDRVLELFGEGSNLYGVIWAAVVAHAAGDTSAFRAVVTRWLPKFRSLAAESPDNLRAQGAAMCFEAFLGDTAGVRQRGRRIISASERHEPGTGDMADGFIWLAWIGDHDLAIRYLQAVSPVAFSVAGEQLGWISLLFDGGPRDPRTWPEFQEAARASKRGVADLHKRF